MAFGTGMAIGGRDRVLYLGRQACGLKLRELATAVGLRNHAVVATNIASVGGRSPRADSLAQGVPMVGLQDRWALRMRNWFAEPTPSAHQKKSFRPRENRDSSLS